MRWLRYCGWALLGVVSSGWVKRWLRYSGWTLLGVVLLGVAGLGVVWATGSRSKSIGQLYADRALHNLTATECIKKGGCDLVEKAPIAAPAEYRRCGEIVSGTNIGEPLGCSERLLTDLLLRESSPGQTAYRQLRRGCRQHDLCYRHGKATYGVEPEQCDQEFLAENLRECWLIYGNDSEEKGANRYLNRREIDRRRCQGRATLAYLAVSWAGRKHFKGTESSTLCEYEGGPHAARDQVVAGRFLGGPSDTALDYVMSLSLTPDQTALTLRLLTVGPDGQSVERAATSIAPGDVAVEDRDWVCPARRRKADDSFADPCPERLGQSLHKSAAQWLRFPPIVVDADGDGSDELVIPSLVPDFGLVFTHIRVKQDGDAVVFEPARAFLGPARLTQDNDSIKECNGLEFADCSGASHGTSTAPLSGEAANQHLGFQFTVMTSADVDCAAGGQAGKQDVVLLSAFSHMPEKSTEEVKARWGWDSDYVLRRFVFDAQGRHWRMRRDRFNNDNHRLAGCTVKLGRDQFQTHARLQYPPFPVRMPQAKDASAVGAACPREERLGLISRDKCTTTSPVSKAGSLFDIDVMLYKIKPKYTRVTDDDRDRGDDDLKMAEVHWLPVLWPETADPVLTSRFARDSNIAMVSTYIGGTETVGTGEVEPSGLNDRQREGHHPVIAVVRADRLGSPIKSTMHRYADTMGYAPELYGVFKSSRFASGFPRTVSERRFNLWDPHRYGSAKLYFRLPSVLAPFTTGGRRGVSVVYFANSALWAKTDDPDKKPSPRLAIRDGWFRLLIVTIEPKGIDAGLMVDCPAEAIADAGALPARHGRGYGDFLQREPVLVGKFFASDKGGSLAVAWRDTAGAVRLTAVRHEAGKWKFGNRECARPDGLQLQPFAELYRGKLN